MDTLKKSVNKIFDIIEVYIPMICFCVFFVFFIVIIAYRYIFYKQIASLTELITILFVWSTVLAAPYATRTGTHVEFSILYDKLTEKRKLVIRLIGEILTIVMFCILFPFAYRSINFFAMQKTPIIKMPYNIVFLPFLVFVALTLIHYAVLLSRDIKIVIKMLKGKSKI